MIKYRVVLGSRHASKLACALVLALTALLAAQPASAIQRKPSPRPSPRPPAHTSIHSTQPLPQPPAYQTPRPSVWPSAYEILDRKAKTIDSSNSTTGWAYIVSGAVALGISVPMYYLSDDVFAQAVYGIGQTLGVGAVSYGSYLVLIENDYLRFKMMLDKTSDLTPSQRDRLSAEFLRDNAARAKNVRKIRVIGHGLTAALNFLSAATSSNREIKTAFFFLGGINTLAALSFGITRSEEEKLADSVNVADSSESGLRASPFYARNAAGAEAAGLALSLPF